MDGYLINNVSLYGGCSNRTKLHYVSLDNTNKSQQKLESIYRERGACYILCVIIDYIYAHVCQKWLIKCRIDVRVWWLWSNAPIWKL